MGINLGAFIAPLVCGYLGQRVNWHIGFAAAGVGMVLGLVQYLLGAQVSRRRRPAPRAGGIARRGRSRCGTRARLVGGVVAGRGRGLIASGMYTGALPITADADRRCRRLRPAGASSIVFFGWLFFGGDWTPAERRRLYAIGALFVASAIFWSEFEQAGSTLNLFGDRATRTEVFGWTFPSSYFQSLQPLFIITFAPVFAWLWMRLGRREPSSPAKFGARPALRRRRLRHPGRRRATWRRTA